MQNKLLNLLFPRTCINCQTQGEYLCKTCKKLLIPHVEICPYCHKFSADYKTCLNCKTDKSNYLEWLIIVFSYKDLIKKLILQIKYYHKSDTAEFLTERLIMAINCNHSLPNKLNIWYVPSHRFRHYFVKGYNQSKLLAQKLSEKTWFHIIDLAQKIHHTHTQAWLNRSQRLSNLSNVFSLNTQNIQDWETLLIIDDVTTTWTTINELAKTIKSQFPKIKIRWAVLARHN